MEVPLNHNLWQCKSSFWFEIISLSSAKNTKFYKIYFRTSQKTNSAKIYELRFQRHLQLTEKRLCYVLSSCILYKMANFDTFWTWTGFHWKFIPKRVTRLKTTHLCYDNWLFMIYFCNFMKKFSITL